MPVLVGLMSGTSLDGISAAAVRFETQGDCVSHELLAYDVEQYSDAQRDRLTQALSAGTPEEYCRLNVDVGELLARAALKVMAECGVPRDEIVIASHGQTIWHVPGHSTWQLGESAVIAERTGCRVLSDFRVADVAAGGQGAPLVPIADALLFSHPTRFRGLQNLGGIGNVTVVPPGGQTVGVRAFDTGPGVVVIDGVVRRLFAGQRYDENGMLAQAGTVVHGVVEQLLEHRYFAAEPPKSTGRELFNGAYIDAFIDRCRAGRASATPHDVVATAVAFSSASVADALRRFVAEPLAELIVSGGGAKNPALVSALSAAVRPLPVRRFDDVFYDGEAKEAVAFALMGYLHLGGHAGNVPSATGARGRRVLGKLTPAPVAR